MNQKERMLNNLPYRAWLDGLEEERLACKTKTYEYNNIPPRDRAKRKELMRTIVGKIGEEFNISSAITATTSRSERTSTPTIIL